jgi:hypothetical protein
MSHQATESFKLEAINTVFSRLGGENVEMIRNNLRIDYKIDLDGPDLFAIEELQIALQRLVGQHGASLLIREIQSEIQSLEES